MRVPDIVIDTNVFVAALRSTRGVSYKLLRQIGQGDFEIYLSVPLVLEYEYAVLKQLSEIGLRETDVADILDYICAAGHHKEVSFLWRPHVKDPGDDMIMELAFAAGCDWIVTYNRKDFVGAMELGVGVVTPKEFMERIDLI
ncbi:MAG: putative toxin-antitoxin system toxin component, PIN family [Planctomycetota bacterium]